jgi:hypothetical protein
MNQLTDMIEEASNDSEAWEKIFNMAGLGGENPCGISEFFKSPLIYGDHPGSGFGSRFSNSSGMYLCAGSLSNGSAFSCTSS